MENLKVLKNRARACDVSGDHVGAAQLHAQAAREHARRARWGVWVCYFAAAIAVLAFVAQLLLEVF